MSLLDGLRALRRSHAPIPQEAIAMTPIGVVRNSVREPRPHGWQDVRSDILLRDDLLPALEALEGFSHLIVVFQLHAVPAEAQRLAIPVGNEDEPPERGVLATRSQLRPNALGVSVVPLIERRGVVLRVRGLDAIDGTPVLDVKPYLPQYDAVPDATLPGWAIARE